MNLENISLKKLCKSDLTTLVNWAAIEGWNPGKNDVEVFWNTDPNGFYGFYYDDKLIAGGAIISYNNEFGFMGLFIVHHDFRSQGIGNKLWYLRRDLLINRLNSNASIGMDGVVLMQGFYNKGGFNLAYRDERYEFNGTTISFSTNISAINKVDYENIIAYDVAYFGCRRSIFLDNWLSMPQSMAIKYTKDNIIVGYAVIRKAETGYKIGPLFANDDNIADDLFKSCLSYAHNDLVYLDIPTTNKNAVNLVKKYKGKYVFECGRMYYGAVPKIEINNIYGITTFELG